MRILIVDDSRVMRSVIKRCLVGAGLGAAEIFEAGDARSALLVLEAQRPDLVLTDLYMPGLDGMELLGEVRRRADPVAVGFITSETHPSLHEEARAGGAAFVLTKPPTAAALGRAIASLPGPRGAAGR